MSLQLLLLRILPKNLLSAASGRLASLSLPRPLNLAVIRWFAKRYGVKVGEASRPLEEYLSLADFFIRDLRPGLRPIGEGIVAPVDGAISELGRIVKGRLLQAKGRDYPLAELVCDDSLAERFQNGFFLTFYLAPGDYHHVHSPVSGEIKGFRAVAGNLWPVNPVSVRAIPKLFCQNERVISLVDSRDFGTVAVVKVGATNVGSIALAYDSFIANRRPVSRLFGGRPYEESAAHFGPGRQRSFRKEFRERIPIAGGERLGTFRLGSTVVLLFEPERFIPGDACRPGPVIYGTTLNRIAERTE